MRNILQQVTVDGRKPILFKQKDLPATVVAARSMEPMSVTRGISFPRRSGLSTRQFVQFSSHWMQGPIVISVTPLVIRIPGVAKARRTRESLGKDLRHHLHGVCCNNIAAQHSISLNIIVSLNGSRMPFCLTVVAL